MPSPKWIFDDNVFRSYLRARRVPGVAIVVLGMAVVSVIFGTWPSRFPTLSSNPAAQVPFWRMLVLVLAVLPVIALNSSLADLEAVATRAFRTRQCRYLLVGSIASITSYLTICATALPFTVIAIMLRGWLGWLGLALVSGALLGWRLAWIIPVFVGTSFWYWGFDSSSQRYHRWEFSAQPPSDLLSILLVVMLLMVGIAAYAATPWRRRAFLPYRSAFAGRMRPWQSVDVSRKP